MFESVAVEAESSAPLGALRWGVAEGRLFGAENKDCTDAPSPDFSAALERFYAAPATVGPDPEREEHYDAILDEFRGGDATLSADHQKRLDSIVTKVRESPKLVVLVAGFGDAMDKDPVAASEQRSVAAVAYLTGKGVAPGNIKATSFGAAWARALPSMKEGRNRRVQIRLRY
jgi:outer membrane protein OmpA-like peptidoglycan-associated protein